MSLDKAHHYFTSVAGNTTPFLDINQTIFDQFIKYKTPEASNDFISKHFYAVAQQLKYFSSKKPIIQTNIENFRTFQEIYKNNWCADPRIHEGYLIACPDANPQFRHSFYEDPLHPWIVKAFPNSVFFGFETNGKRGAPDGVLIYNNELLTVQIKYRTNYLEAERVGKKLFLPDINSKYNNTNVKVLAMKDHILIETNYVNGNQDHRILDFKPECYIGNPNIQILTEEHIKILEQNDHLLKSYSKSWSLENVKKKYNDFFFPPKVVSVIKNETNLLIEAKSLNKLESRVTVNTSVDEKSSCLLPSEVKKHQQLNVNNNQHNKLVAEIKEQNTKNNDEHCLKPSEIKRKHGNN